MQSSASFDQLSLPPVLCPSFTGKTSQHFLGYEKKCVQCEQHIGHILPFPAVSSCLSHKSYLIDQSLNADRSPCQISLRQDLQGVSDAPGWEAAQDTVVVASAILSLAGSESLTCCWVLHSGSGSLRCSSNQSDSTLADIGPMSVFVHQG